jgi:hypothetical protein
MKPKCSARRARLRTSPDVRTKVCVECWTGPRGPRAPGPGPSIVLVDASPAFEDSVCGRIGFPVWSPDMRRTGRDRFKVLQIQRTKSAKGRKLKLQQTLIPTTVRDKRRGRPLNDGDAEVEGSLRLRFKVFKILTRL